eukprot:Transcript_25320.p1 GENE.Transcript_25320~~Transcript_25320.p1  ORF type:complete len:550 (-),score=210.81 Transcript_25320:709-2163(-)
MALQLEPAEAKAAAHFALLRLGARGLSRRAPAGVHNVAALAEASEQRARAARAAHACGDAEAAAAARRGKGATAEVDVFAGLTARGARLLEELAAGGAVAREFTHGGVLEELATAPELLALVGGSQWRRWFRGTAAAIARLRAAERGAPPPAPDAEYAALSGRTERWEQDLTGDARLIAAALDERMEAALDPTQADQLQALREAGGRVEAATLRSELAQAEVDESAALQALPQAANNIIEPQHPFGPAPHLAAAEAQRRMRVPIAQRCLQAARGGPAYVAANGGEAVPLTRGLSGAKVGAGMGAGMGAAANDVGAVVQWLDLVIPADTADEADRELRMASVVERGLDLIGGRVRLQRLPSLSARGRGLAPAVAELKATARKTADKTSAALHIEPLRPWQAPRRAGEPASVGSSRSPAQWCEARVATAGRHTFEHAEKRSTFKAAQKGAVLVNLHMKGASSAEVAGAPEVDEVGGSPAPVSAHSL